MTQIDNKKMWESLLKAMPRHRNGEFVYSVSLTSDTIIEALKDQGLTVNDNGEIVETGNCPCDSCDSQNGGCALTCSKYKEYARKKTVEPQHELTEFEQAISQTIESYSFLPHDIDHCVNKEDAIEFYHKAADCLLSIARKQIASEIDANAMESEFRGGVSSYGSIYRQGIEDVVKLIKGE